MLIWTSAPDLQPAHHPFVFDGNLFFLAEGERMRADYCNTKTASSVYALDGDTISKHFDEKFPFVSFDTGVAIWRLYASNM